MRTSPNARHRQPEAAPPLSRWTAPVAAGLLAGTAAFPLFADPARFTMAASCPSVPVGVAPGPLGLLVAVVLACLGVRGRRARLALAVAGGLGWTALAAAPVAPALSAVPGLLAAAAAGTAALALLGVFLVRDAVALRPAAARTVRLLAGATFLVTAGACVAACGVPALAGGTPVPLAIAVGGLLALGVGVAALRRTPAAPPPAPEDPGPWHEDLSKHVSPSGPTDWTAVLEARWRPVRRQRRRRDAVIGAAGAGVAVALLPTAAPSVTVVGWPFALAPEATDVAGVEPRAVLVAVAAALVVALVTRPRWAAPWLTAVLVAGLAAAVFARFLLLLHGGDDGPRMILAGAAAAVTTAAIGWTALATVRARRPEQALLAALLAAEAVHLAVWLIA